MKRRCIALVPVLFSAAIAFGQAEASPELSFTVSGAQEWLDTGGRQCFTDGRIEIGRASKVPSMVPHPCRAVCDRVGILTSCTITKIKTSHGFSRVNTDLSQGLSDP